MFYKLFSNLENLRDIENSPNYKFIKCPVANLKRIGY